MKRIILLACSALTLSACSGDPLESEMIDTIERHTVLVEEHLDIEDVTPYCDRKASEMVYTSIDLRKSLAKLRDEYGEQKFNETVHDNSDIPEAMEHFEDMEDDANDYLMELRREQC